MTLLAPALSFGAIESVNPFAYPLLVAAGLYASTWYNAGRPGRFRKYSIMLSRGRLKYAVLAFAAVSALGLLVFEVYFSVYECQVSDAYTSEVIALTKETISVLERLNVPYWFDYASLLCVLRAQYNLWDHDQDLSLMYPENDDEVKKLIDRFREEGLMVYWDEQRDLLQVYRGAPGAEMTNNTPHVDLWMWVRDTDRETGKPLIVTKDYTVEYRWREWDHIFPILTHDYVWQGMNVSVPHEPHIVSDKEYSVYGGSYLDAQVFRGDCFHNFFNGRWAYSVE